MHFLKSLWANFGVKICLAKVYRNNLAMTHQNAWKDGHRQGHLEAKDLMTVMAREIWAMAEEAGREAAKEERLGRMLREDDEV